MTAASSADRFSQQHWFALSLQPVSVMSCVVHPIPACMCRTEPRCTAQNHGEGQFLLGTPALFPYSQWVQQLKGAAFQPLGTLPQKKQEESLAPDHNNHCIPTTHAVSTASVRCTLLQARGRKMHLNRVPSRDLLIAICSRKLWFTLAINHKLAWSHHRQTLAHPEVLHPFWKGNGSTYAIVLLPPKYPLDYSSF